ncbi:MAG: methionyl-tRNA formyltransferase [Bacteroidia bacterium]|nr:methionyl-tRNA formyltransferase [Bacteroidia bacterium]
MKIVFMGTPDFAVRSLELLLDNGYEVVGVVTAPDKPSGRGQQMSASAVKKFAIERNLKVLQPVKLKDQNFLNELRNLQADLQFVVAFRMLPEEVWNMPKLGTYNLHASLLPNYRGAAPINWAVINGEQESGVTTFKLKHEIDTGNILYQEKVSITPEMNAGDLHDVLMEKGAKLIVKTAAELKRCLDKNEEPLFKVQDETKVSHAPKIFKDTCRINWNKNALQIHNLIRGLSPYPTAFTILSGAAGEERSIKIFASAYELAPHNNTNGSLITDAKSYIKVYCKDGVLEIKDLQLEGKRRMSVSEFLRGYRFNHDDRFLSS